MATVDKNFKVKHGLVVEGTTATVNGENIITTGSTTDNLQEGSTNVYFTDARAKDSAAALLTTATLTNITITGTGNGGLTITAENGVADSDTDDLAEGTSNLYFTNQRALDATAAAYDAAGAAAAAQTAAQSYADTAAGNAQSNAEAYTDAQLTNYTTTANLDTAVDGLGYLKSADLSGYATESYVGTAIDNLVDGAPGLLDTLNEIAAAINDDANYATTMTTALAGKQNSLTAGDNISIVSDTISVTGLQASDISDFATAAQTANIGYYDPAGSASSAQQAAEDYADTVSLTAENNAKGYADATFVTPSSLSTTLASYVEDSEKGATGGVATLDGTGNVPLSQLGNVPAAYVTSVGTNLDVTAGELTIAETPDFTAVTISDIAKQVAAEASGFATLPATIYSFAHTTYRAGEFLIKTTSGSHTEISKILLTLDTSNNIAITEYGTVGTNGTLTTLTAVVDGSDVLIKATPVNDSSFNLVGTLLN